jgi:hypothetical protein
MAVTMKINQSRAASGIAHTCCHQELEITLRGLAHSILGMVNINLRLLLHHLKPLRAEHNTKGD